MENGWIKIYRKFQDWEWYSDSQAVHLFLHLLLSANIKDKKWKGKNIYRGEFISSVKSLSEATGIPTISVRRKLKILQESGVILIKTTNRFSDITICKYDDYQTNEQTNEQQLKNIRNKEEKKERNNSPNGGLSASAFDAQKEKPKAKQKKEPTIVTKARNIFEPFFEKKTGEKYYWKAADAVQMKRLINQLKFSRANKNLPTTDDDLLVALQVFLDKINDNWMLANLSVPNISSKYNELVVQARKQKGQIGMFLRDNTDEKYLNQKIKQWK